LKTSGTLTQSKPRVLRLQAQELRASLDVWQQALLELRLQYASTIGLELSDKPAQAGRSFAGRRAARHRAGTGH
jgi:hypothetical protein